MVKAKVRGAKAESWKNWADSWRTVFKKIRNSYKVLNNLRKDKPCPIKYIKAEDGTLLTKERILWN